MVTRDYIKDLMLMIDNLLSGVWGVEEFRQNYYYFYLEDVPDSLLLDKQVDFFGGIQEKLDWVDESPDFESCAEGWIDYKQYVSWVREQRVGFLKNQ